MEINIQLLDKITVVEMSGDLDGNTAPGVQAQVLQLIKPGESLLLDMSHVPYMSSAGLRMMLSTHRTVTSKNSRVVLVGLSEELRDTMSATGFLDFFTTCETLDQGLQALGQ